MKSRIATINLALASTILTAGVAMAQMPPQVQMQQAPVQQIAPAPAPAQQVAPAPAPAPVPALIQEGVYDGGPNKIFIKAVATNMPNRTNVNYFGLIVSENAGGGMLAKPYKIEIRGGRQAWIPIHQSCTLANNLCRFTGYLTLPAKGEAFYWGTVVPDSGGREVLNLTPSAPYSKAEGRALPAICQSETFGRGGFHKIANRHGGDYSWLDINMLPASQYRFTRNWNETGDRDAARMAVPISRAFTLDASPGYKTPDGRVIFGLQPGSYSVSQTMAGLGEVRLQLDDANTRSGIAVDEPMNAVAIYLRYKNKNTLVMMDARPGLDNCNMMAMTFVQE